ncbi:MAG: hypothetical protein AAF430_12315 [Myxococcota bacterium]
MNLRSQATPLALLFVPVLGAPTASAVPQTNLCPTPSSAGEAITDCSATETVYVLDADTLQGGQLDVWIDQDVQWPGICGATHEIEYTASCLAPLQLENLQEGGTHPTSTSWIDIVEWNAFLPGHPAGANLTYAAWPDPEGNCPACDYRGAFGVSYDLPHLFFPPQAPFPDGSPELQMSFSASDPSPGEACMVKLGRTWTGQVFANPLPSDPSNVSCFPHPGLSPSHHTEVDSVGSAIALTEIFDIKYASFIPTDSIPSPGPVPGGFCFPEPDIPIPTLLRFGGDSRGFDPDPAAPARLTALVSLVPDEWVSEMANSPVNATGVVAGSEKIFAGATKTFAPPAYADGVINASDEDATLNDCYLLHERDTYEVKEAISPSRIEPDRVAVVFQGSADNPLVSVACAIDWDIYLAIDSSGAWDLAAIVDAFPSHELYVNGTPVLEIQASDFGVVELCNPFSKRVITTSGNL